ncbi:MAG: D-alanine--D-alanine ligase [Planctomycetia bacterium]|nr:D-alanine--D-alanine ligase [Planctomycetia bacterium]
MKIGITYDLKSDALDAAFLPPGWNDEAGTLEVPDDLQEEFDSPATIEAIAAVLRDLGHEVQWMGDGRRMLERVLAEPPEFVFNFAEGHGIGRSREARVPAVLEMLGIPYTGSDPLTLAVTLDKDCAKRLVKSAGGSVPGGYLVSPDAELSNLAARHDVGYPAIVKPAWEGSSKGIRSKCLVRGPAELPDAVAAVRRDHRQPVLVEEFIQGDELTVGMVGNEPPRIVGIMRVHPTAPSDHFIYSLEVKRDFRRQVRYECPALLPNSVLERISQAALLAWQALGCRDVSRIDFRLRDGVPYFLEVNPLPGLNPESSDLVILAQLAGWSYPQLIEAILQAALERTTAAVGLSAR